MYARDFDIPLRDLFSDHKHRIRTLFVNTTLPHGYGGPVTLYVCKYNSSRFTYETGGKREREKRYIHIKKPNYCVGQPLQ